MAEVSHVMPNSHRPPDKTRQCCLSRVRRCELSRPDRPTNAICVGVRPAVAPAVPAPPDTLRGLTHLSGCRADSIHTAIPDTTRRSCLSCMVCRCQLGDCSERVQTSNFLSATVLSWESNSHRRSGRDTDKTVLSCLAWRRELTLTLSSKSVTNSSRKISHLLRYLARFYWR